MDSYLSLRDPKNEPWEYFKISGNWKSAECKTCQSKLEIPRDMAHGKKINILKKHVRECLPNYKQLKREGLMDW